MAAAWASRASVRRWRAGPDGPGSRTACLPAGRGVLGPVEQAGLEESSASACWARSRSAGSGRRATAGVHAPAHGAVVFAPAPEQVAQCEMQLGRVRVVLHRFDEGIDGLVLLLVEQVVQALEIRLGGAAVLLAQLAQVEARGQPAQPKASGKPSNIQLRSNSMERGLWLRERSGCGCGWVCRGGRAGCRRERRARLTRRAAMPPPARHHAQHAHHQSGREGRQHHQHHRRPPLRAEEEMHGGVCWLFSAKAKSVKKMAALSSHRRYFMCLPERGGILRSAPVPAALRRAPACRRSLHSTPFGRLKPLPCMAECCFLGSVNGRRRLSARRCAGLPPRAAPCPA